MLFRSYMDHSCVQIAIYDNRVEITSPGMLYGGLTLEQAISGRSKIRNVCIAEIFSRMGIIEQWGTGLQRMIQGCREYGVREPEFIDMGDAFRVNFYRSSINTSIENIENFAESGTEMASSGMENRKTDIENIETGIEVVEDKLVSVLSDTEKKVVGLILKNPEITQDKMAEIMGMSKSGIRYIMNKLKKRGILVRVGATKRGKWSINLY